MGAWVVIMAEHLKYILGMYTEVQVNMTSYIHLAQVLNALVSLPKKLFPPHFPIFLSP